MTPAPTGQVKPSLFIQLRDQLCREVAISLALPRAGVGGHDGDALERGRVTWRSFPGGVKSSLAKCLEARALLTAEQVQRYRPRVPRPLESDDERNWASPTVARPWRTTLESHEILVRSFHAAGPPLRFDGAGNTGDSESLGDFDV